MGALEIILLVMVVAAIFYGISNRNSTQKESVENVGQGSAGELGKHAMPEEAYSGINTVLRIAAICDGIEPIMTQMRDGVAGRSIPEGGIWDSYMRGYLMGYIEALLALNGAGGIDRNPRGAIEVFSVMFGGEDGLTELNECLQERSKQENSDSGSLFMMGYNTGLTDYRKHYLYTKYNLGQQPEALRKYIGEKTF